LRILNFAPHLPRHLRIVKIPRPSLPFPCLKLGRKFVIILAGYESDEQGDIVGKECPLYRPAHLYLLLRLYTMQTRSTPNGKIRREIQNPQIFETDPESFSPAIYSSNFPCPVTKETQLTKILGIIIERAGVNHFHLLLIVCKRSKLEFITRDNLT
jgi:hypothetical protein